MIYIKRKLKNFGLLEILVLGSLVYVTTMLIDGGDNSKLSLLGSSTGSGTIAFTDGSSSNYDKVRMQNIKDLEWQYRDFVLTA